MKEPQIHITDGHDIDGNKSYMRHITIAVDNALDVLLQNTKEVVNADSRKINLSSTVDA